MRMPHQKWIQTVVNLILYHPWAKDAMFILAGVDIPVEENCHLDLTECLSWK